MRNEIHRSNDECNVYISNIENRVTVYAITNLFKHWYFVKVANNSLLFTNTIRRV